MTKSRVVVVTGVFLVGATMALFLTLLLAKSSGTTIYTPKAAAAETESAVDTPGLGPASGAAWESAIRTYPANAISPAVVAKAQATFARIANRDARLRATGRSFLWSNGPQWQQYGPQQFAVQPGVTSFSGATNQTASRITALVVSPDCGQKGNGGGRGWRDNDKGGRCTVWATPAGGGVWRTEDALAPNPKWQRLTDNQLDQHSTGALYLDPTDAKHKTLYLGTGEGNHCSSGCESGVGVYKSTNGGNTWTKLGDTCVDNATYTCVNHGDAFLGRAINSIAVDPTNPNHIFVGSAQAVRGLSHVIGSGGTSRLEPGANSPGLYESSNGGATFTEVWNAGPANFGVTKIKLDPRNPTTVYASAYEAGLWRRSPALDGSASPTDFHQVFAAQFASPDRTMFDLTVKSGKTRIYLTDGAANGAGIAGPTAANFWRLDNADQPAATLLASQTAGATPPPDTTTFPTTYNGWQNLTSKTTASPYFATDDFCTGQCWYDEDVYTPAGMPDTVYLIGSNQYGEQPCDTKGVGCGNGRSNGREVLYSTTAGDPDGTANSRTFTDLSYDATNQPATWCAYAPYFDNGCVFSPNGIHPDQHAIAINPSNPTQIFEGSDGGMIRTSGAFADTSSQCDEPHRNGGAPLPPTSGSYLSCKRLLSRVPTELAHIDQTLGSTIQFWNVAIDPFSTCRVLGGTQDNGTWANGPNCDRDTFDQVIYGDGGDALFDSTTPNWMANGFTSGFGDVNFENGDPTKWVISTGNILAQGETASFYWPQIADPNPPAGTHPIFQGFQHVWRSWAFGAGHVSVPQQTTPDIAYYEANCPEFVTSGASANCGDYQPLGGPKGANQPGDLTGSVYGADRAGGFVSWMARDGADHGTLWATTSAGRVFVTHNADAVDPATVVWHRIDSSTSGNSPTRYPSAITIDPADPGHAWISYSGYNAATPTTPGHVFSVSENGTAPGSGTFTNLNVESGTSAFPTPTNSGDLPVADIVRDDQTHTLYVATDFGVLSGRNDGQAGWHVTQGMPRYEVTHLELQPSNRVATCVGMKHCPRVLYAATHSQGIWKMRLGQGRH
ncbi:MAG TPA: hypothetical protein VFK62_06490 [Gaiellaceae bacterium]|nr:hypothetical protein [Gaiellaceae bacterium]